MEHKTKSNVFVGIEEHFGRLKKDLARIMIQKALLKTFQKGFAAAAWNSSTLNRASVADPCELGSNFPLNLSKEVSICTVENIAGR